MFFELRLEILRTDHQIVVGIRIPCFSVNASVEVNVYLIAVFCGTVYIRILRIFIQGTFNLSLHNVIGYFRFYFGDAQTFVFAKCQVFGISAPGRTPCQKCHGHCCNGSCCNFLFHS